MREWLNAQAAGGYVELRPGQRPLHAAARADGGAHRSGQPRVPARLLPDRARLGASTRPRSSRRPAAATGSAGTSTSTTCTRAASASSGPATTPTSSPSGCPALDGVVDEAGARRAGRRRRLRARRLDDPDGAGVPELDVRGLRLPRRRRSRPRAGGPRRRASPTASASRSRPAAAYPGGGYDLVTMFDCLHDMGDPVGAARHVRSTLTPDGTWMIVEPHAGDRVEDNLNPVGRAYYGVLDAAVHARVAVAGGRAGARRPGGRGADPRRRRGAAASPASAAPPRRPFNLVFEARP